MAKIVGVDPRKKCTGNLMACICNIHPINTMVDQNENWGREKPKKRAGNSIQGILETQIEIVEAENHSLGP